MNNEPITADIAIVGAGAAGLTTALAMPTKYRVAVFSKRPLGDAASAWAQGGIAAAVGGDDDHNSHLNDTLAAGDGLCVTDTVRTVVEGAPAAIAWLTAQGVPFNHAADGKLALGREGGHGKRRIVHVEDRSGAAIMDALITRVRAQPNITLYENFIAVDLSVQDNRCRGFYALDIKRRQVCAVNADNVVLATGGASRVYLYSSTPEDATGDGVAMAFRAGCRIRNMEFVQFHPTCLYHPQPPTLLISEAVRGEGGRLVNNDGEHFTDRAHPDGDLASRDIVARAIDDEMKKSGSDCVYLDCGAHNEQFWRRRFPSIVSQCEKRGVRIPADRIPVVPAAHYCCGGIRTDLHGTTDIANLYAVGETAETGLHGANRLASNSLLECVVIARRCAAHIAATKGEKAENIKPWDEQRISPAREAVLINHNWDELRRIMWNYVGIVRSDERLQRARRRVEWIREEISEYYRRHIVSRDFLELRNLTQCAELIIEGAMARRENRGLHFNINCDGKKKSAVDTELSLADFTARRQSVNTLCPFSKRLVTAGSTTTYRGHIVGFCNPDCRDSFTRAAAANFVGAGENILGAKNMFEKRIQHKSEMPAS